MNQELRERPRTSPATSNRNFCVTLARRTDEVREIQALRYQVFGGELDARVQGNIPGHDSDFFDPYCRHLLARETESNKLVGSFRILSPGAASRVGSYHAENVFDIDRLRKLRPRMAEVGRCCIHPNYRSAGVSTLLWAKLVEHLLIDDQQIMIGCASIGIADGGRHAASVFRQIRPQQMAPIDYRVFPLHRLPFEDLADERRVAMPPLIEEYLGAGAWVCGEPAWNSDFNTAELMLMLPLARFTRRHNRQALPRSA
ncbi:GNAT family N-acyltransferase [Candidatus Accumulibacter sp. ACC003]|uniref:GNAT family N-acetyltransferase n=1 Tax=Candidatus Accumulibacter sp. ACC003 TaxID=2823334 RepID=UPI0025C6D776|nr:GNAT family N-acyltransferase [Candidatus Accumulibacter sp. ACC003]